MSLSLTLCLELPDRVGVLRAKLLWCFQATFYAVVRTYTFAATTTTTLINNSSDYLMSSRLKLFLRDQLR